MKKKQDTSPELDFTDAFFREVSEDLQNDNLKAFWKKYGVQIVAFVAVCLTIAVSFETIKHWKDVNNQKWSNAFTYAQGMYNQGKKDEGLASLANIAKDGNDIYADVAEMKIINLMLEEKKSDEALKKLEDFAQNANSVALKNLALMKLATYKVDRATPEEMMKILSPIINSERENVWKLEAYELLALTHLSHNQNDQAVKIYEGILKNHNVNDMLRIRAQNMISVLTSAGDNK